jgi:uncharacterized protein (TIGR02594 family)
MHITAFELAQRFTGIQEIGGSVDNPQLMAMLKLDNNWPDHDEVPWCSAFVNYICWLLRLPRSKDLRARSWLEVGKSVDLNFASVGFDIVILKRGTDDGPDVINAPGHVGFYAGHDDRWIEVLGGNQSDTVKVSKYAIDRLLSVRSLR